MVLVVVMKGQQALIPFAPVQKLCTGMTALKQMKLLIFLVPVEQVSLIMTLD